MSQSYFIVESPLQLLNAVEARNHYGVKDGQLIVLSGVSRKNFKQIRELSQEFNWRKIRYVSSLMPWLGRYWAMFALNHILRHTADSVDFVFIGDYRSELMRHFAHMAKPRRNIALDDGNSSITIQKMYFHSLDIRKAKVGNRAKILVAGILNWFLRLKDKDLPNLEFFSIYHGEHPKCQFNNYAFIKSNLKSFEVAEEVYFLGSPTPEIGVLAMDGYFQALEKVKQYYSGKTVLYISHRRESQSKLDHISEVLGFEVVEFPYPVEWAIVRTKRYPVELSAIFSSALDNCFRIFGKSFRITSFEIDGEFINRKDQERVASYYTQYRDYGEGFDVIAWTS